MNEHLHPVMQAALQRAQDEAQRVAADIRADRFKNSGALRRMEDDAALAEQIKHGADQ